MLIGKISVPKDLVNLVEDIRRLLDLVRTAEWSIVKEEYFHYVGQ